MHAVLMRFVSVDSIKAGTSSSTVVAGLCLCTFQLSLAFRNPIATVIGGGNLERCSMALFEDGIGMMAVHV